MEINWFTILIAAVLGLGLVSHLVRQNLKDKKEADKDYKSVKKYHREGYETNDQEM